MQLRSSTRLPGRYREDDDPDLPVKAVVVHRTAPYNPNLPPAAFPTLEFPRPVNNIVVEVMAGRGVPESFESGSEQEKYGKRATVFRGFEEGGHPELNPGKLHTVNWLDEDVTEPGEYDGWGVMANDVGNDRSARIGLSAYKPIMTWSQLTNGLKLVIVMELMDTYSFGETARKLRLTDEEQNELVDLSERETARQAEEENKITSIQARQLENLMSGGPETNREALSSAFDDLCAEAEDPPAFMIKKSDIEHARCFLESVQLKEYADRLWRYEGVAQSRIVLNLRRLNASGLSNKSRPALPSDKRYHLQSPEKERVILPNNKKRKSEATFRNEEILLPIKRHRMVRRPISTSLPTRLRTSFSADDLKETVALDPPALQTGFSPCKQLPPPIRKQPPNEKNPIAPHIKFAKKATEPSIRRTPPKKSFTQPKHTPGSSTTKGEVFSNMADQVKPHTPPPPSPGGTFSPPSTPSRAPIIQQNTAKVRIAQMEVSGKKTDVMAPAVTLKDRKPAFGQTRKRAYELDDDPDL